MHSRSCRLSATRLLGAAALAFLAACNAGDDADDTAGVDTAVAMAPARADTMAAPAGMPNRGPAKDADHEFLRMMADHHAGLIAMAMPAMTRASQPSTQGDAHNMHTKQEQEQKDMVAMVQRDYAETLTPMVMPAHKAMNDSLQAMTGADYDRTFYGNVIAHHREGIRMVDDYLPRLTRPAVRRMAEQMKADQQKEITELEQKRQKIGASV